MADIPKLTEKLIEVTEGAKVFSTQIANCCMYGDKSVDAVVIVFTNGRTEVSCPVSRGDCSCRYGYRSPIRAPRPWYKMWSNWVVIALIVGVGSVVFWLAIHIPPL